MSILTASVGDAAAIAAELGISYDLFLRTRKDLEKRGFPSPLPLVARKGKGRPRLRWSLDAVRDWIRNPRAAAPAAGNIVRMPARDRDTLNRRLG